MTNVILLEGVYKRGRVGDVVEVKPGFARNFLIPQGKAVLATQENLQSIDQIRQRASESEQARIDSCRQKASTLERGPVFIEVRTADSNRIFGSVKARDVVKAIRDQLEVVVSVESILLHNEIRTVGVYRIVARLHPEVSANIDVIVFANKEDAELFHIDLMSVDERIDLAYKKLDDLAPALINGKIQDASEELCDIAYLTDDELGFQAKEALVTENGSKFKSSIEEAFRRLEVDSLISLELNNDPLTPTKFHFCARVIEDIQINVGNVDFVSICNDHNMEEDSLDLSLYTTSAARYSDVSVANVVEGDRRCVFSEQVIEFTDHSEAKENWKLWVMVLLNGNCIHRKLWTGV